MILGFFTDHRVAAGGWNSFPDTNCGLKGSNKDLLELQAHLGCTARAALTLQMLPDSRELQLLDKKRKQNSFAK